MATKKKIKIVEGLEETFSKCSVGILTDFRGLPTAELNELRRKLRGSGVDYKVVKNTLAQLAAKKAAKEEIADSFKGPIAVAFGYADITAAVKVLVDYIRTSKSNLSIKAGFLGDRV